jgi:hypothetical protein
MNRRMIILASAALALNLALPRTVHADQAIMSHDALFEISTGESVEHTDTIVVSRYGIATVVFDGASGFANNETVVATITLSTRDGIGTVELLSPSTLTGRTTSRWTTDPPDPASSEFTFDPPVSLRFTAPTATALDCDGRREKVVRTSLRIGATLIGSAGTKASFSADSFPGVVMFDIICPATEMYTEAPAATVVPTHAPPEPSTALARSPLPTSTPTPSPTTAPTPTPLAASATASGTSVATASVQSTAAPTPTPAADMTPAAISLAATVVLVATLAISFVWRRRSG